MFIDTHCHLDAPELASRLPQVLRDAAVAGVTRMIVPGVSPDGWDAMTAVASSPSGIYAAYGIHPFSAGSCTDGDLARLDELAPQGAAVGEVGLDYLCDVPRELQQKIFIAQLRIARGHRLPIIIHCRKAFADLLRILRQEWDAESGGVMHAFSGSVELMRECLALGLHISVSGVVTWSNAVKPVAVAREVPGDRLLLETDAPDLTPEPHRGRVNEPAFLVDVARRVAEIRGVSVEELARVTAENASRLFSLKR